MTSLWLFIFLHKLCILLINACNSGEIHCLFSNIVVFKVPQRRETETKTEQVHSNNNRLLNGQMLLFSRCLFVCGYKWLLCNPKQDNVAPSASRHRNTTHVSFPVCSSLTAEWKCLTIISRQKLLQVFFTGPIKFIESLTRTNQPLFLSLSLSLSHSHTHTHRAVS